MTGSNKLDLCELTNRYVQMLRKDVISEEGSKIGDAIYVHISNFVKEIGKSSPDFAVSEVLKVGSFHEGTKIRRTDEFDFILVLEKFSRKKDEEIIYERKRKDDERIRISLSDNPFLLDDEVSPINALYRHFASLLDMVIRKKEKSTDVEVRPYLLFSTLDEDEMVDLNSVNGIALSVRLYRVKFPNIILEFLCGKLIISVDLTLAISDNDVKKTFNSENATVPAIAEMINSKESILFVVYGEDFQVTMTEVEVEYVKNKMQQKHRIIYMYLKNTNYTYAEKSRVKVPVFHPFSSYMLKTMCIYHDARCETSDQNNYETCFTDILNIMEESLERVYLCRAEVVKGTCVGYLPSIFDRHKNLYNEPEKTVDLLSELRRCFVRDLKSIHRPGRKWQNLQELEKEINTSVAKTSEDVFAKTWSDAKYLSVSYRKMAT